MTTPSVLAVIVVRDAAPWVRRSLAALARQTHPRLGVLAVDNASTDGSADVLERLLGRRRVIRSERNLGFPGGVRRALSVPAAREADFVLLLHDDVALAPNAVEAMVEAAGRFERAGIVGAKVVDWERPEVLREVGFASDRFGHPYSPLEEDEIDHGQYDAPREVLFVSSAAMLVSRDVWQRVGEADERLRPAHGDLDLCWRARVAGFRVVVTPDAVAYHRMAGAREERAERSGGEVSYVLERAVLAAMLKNYRAITLLWILPLYVAQSAIRATGAVVSRRLDEVVGILRAWGWNLIRLPGTIRRRARAQAVRAASDREIARFMTPPGTRLRRLAQQASALVSRYGGATAEEEEAEPEPLRRRAATILSAHPAAVALTVAAFLVLVGFRDVLFADAVSGGALPAFPAGASAFFEELARPWRSAGFGGSGAPSPAVAVLGIAGILTLGDPQLLARLIVALGPLLAAASCFRAVSRVTRDSRAATVAAVAYGLSALALWTASKGRVAVVVLLVILPWLGMRVGSRFDDPPPRSPLRWIVGTAAVLAIAGSFFPAVWLSTVVLVLPVAASAHGRRARAVTLSLGATAVAAILVFPFSSELVFAGRGTGVEAAGRAAFFALLRLSPEPAVGSWLPALFLPLAGILG
ncbi:MAG TPA: glycosyltransferase family 2 protein, partial [Actinomycetota bacterium]|nr:glycosyltransferase family 2 protein [Actinomycetota bacterium]